MDLGAFNATAFLKETPGRMVPKVGMDEASSVFTKFFSESLLGAFLLSMVLSGMSKSAAQ